MAQEQKREESQSSGKLAHFQGKNRDSEQGVTSQILEKGKNIASDVAEYAQDYTAEMTEQAERAIKKHPLQALLVGFGVGCLVGALVIRR